MKKLFLTICLLFSFCLANPFEESIKIYSKDADNLFLNAVSAISTSNDFHLIEMQSKNGYILFLHGSKYYLLTLTKRYQNQTEIKVLPQNSDYSGGSEVAKMVFSLIDNKLKNQSVEFLR